MTFAYLMFIVIISCSSKVEERLPLETPPPPEKSWKTSFLSNNQSLENAYNWAERIAIGYSHDGKDPVGHWYEAALPQREAFCMRDVSHQTVGAEVLGLSKHNLNMLTRFAENISDRKDWCTYWEINRHNRPAPEDYSNDKEFWYNLNANFDMIQACLKMYQWTGDRTYLENKHFTNFYEKSLKEYIERWMLAPDKIMNRPLYMNVPPNFNQNNNFHTCRGLASYVENFPGLTVSADLIASIYAGYKAYSDICALKGDTQAAQAHEATALRYRELLESQWWDSQNNRYHNFWTSNKEFHTGEGSSFILWFNASENPERIRHTVRQILSQDWNVETLSYFPALLYRLGYPQEAYQKLVTLPYQERSTYPEVSYGVIEGIVGGLMGIQPLASKRQITTLSWLAKDSDFAEIKNVPILGGFVTVRHDGRQNSRFENNTGAPVRWRASFEGTHPVLYLGEKEIKATTATDLMGNVTSYIEVEVADKETKQVRI